MVVLPAKGGCHKRYCTPTSTRQPRSSAGAGADANSVQGNRMKSRALIKPFPTPTHIFGSKVITVGGIFIYVLCSSLFIVKISLLCALVSLDEFLQASRIRHSRAHVPSRATVVLPHQFTTDASLQLVCILTSLNLSGAPVSHW